MNNYTFRLRHNVVVTNQKQTAKSILIGECIRHMCDSIYFVHVQALMISLRIVDFDLRIIVSLTWAYWTTFIGIWYYIIMNIHTYTYTSISWYNSAQILFHVVSMTLHSSLSSYITIITTAIGSLKTLRI